MGYSVELFVVRPVHDDLICAVCSDVLCDARSACTEGHVFCRECIDTWASRRDSCPTCRATLQLARSRVIDNAVNALQVRCPHADVGDGHPALCRPPSV